MKQSKFYLVNENSLPNSSHFVSYGTSATKIVGKFSPPTLRLFGALHRASQYFQEELFIKPLTPFIFSLNKNTHSKGYYKPYAWSDNGNSNLPEINIHPSVFLLAPEEMMGTLVHELSHHFHQIYGKPGYNGYHNKEFAQLPLPIEPQ